MQGLSGPWGPIGVESVLWLYWRGSRDDRPLAVHWWTHLPTPHSKGKDVSSSSAVFSVRSFKGTLYSLLGPCTPIWPNTPGIQPLVSWNLAGLVESYFNYKVKWWGHCHQTHCHQYTYGNKSVECKYSPCCTCKYTLLSLASVDALTHHRNHVVFTNSAWTPW